jgi:hypothetical protein
LTIGDIGYDIGMTRSARMHQTTVRFGPDLWSALEEEARRVGVSVAHYVRDAALARLVATGRDASAAAGRDVAWAPSARTHLAERVSAQLDSAEAVRAQGKLARDRSRRLRAQADMLRLRAPAARE